MIQDQETAPTKEWRIATVQYGFTKDLGNFQSERLTIDVTTSAFGSAEAALDYARKWVEQHLSLPEMEVDDMRSQYNYHHGEVQRMEKLVTELRARYDKFKKALDTLGVTVPSEMEDLPF